MNYSPTPPVPDFRQWFESVPGAYLVLTADLTIVAVSDAFLQATQTQRAALVGCPIAALFPHHATESDSSPTATLRRSVERVLRDGITDTMLAQPYSFYAPAAPSQEPEQRYWQLVNSPVFTPTGRNGDRIVTHIIHHADVKRWEDHEIRLQEHQHLLQQVTDTVPGILYVYDWLEKRNIYVSGQVLDNLGFTPEQIQTMGPSVILQLIHPDDLKQLPEYIQQFRSLPDGQVVETEYRLRKANGEWRWFSGREIVFSRTATGTPKQILGTAYDITDRKRTEEALRLEKERFELAATAVDCMIYDWNVETDAVECSDGLTRIFGYTPDQAEPTREWWFAQIHPDDLLLFSEQMLENLANCDRFAVEYRVRHQMQQHRHVLDQGMVVRDARGRAVRVVGTITDISDRKLTETRQQFLLKLNDAMRNLPEPREIIQMMVQVVGEYFDVSRCSYAEIDLSQTYATVDLDFFNGVASLAGKHRLSAFDPAIVALLRQGQTVAIEDVQSDPRTQSCRSGLAAKGTRSLLCVPLVKQEQFVALLMLHHEQPRLWSAKAIALIEDVADRTWIAIEKAQAERALYQSEARFQRLANNVPGVIYRYLLHADGTDSMLYISPGCRSFFELDAETIQADVNRLWSLVHPDDVEELRALIAASAQTHQPIHWEGQYVLSSGSIKWIQMVARPEQQPDGSVLWDGLLTDITGTKEIELEREQLLTRSQHYAAQLRGLTEAALEMDSLLSVEAVLQTIIKAAYSIIGAHQAVIHVATNQDWGNAVSAVHLSNKYAQWRDVVNNPDEAGIYDYVRHIGYPIRLTQLELEAHARWRELSPASADHPPLRGWLAAPLTGRYGHTVGLIQLSDKYEDDFTAEDETILVQLAQMASVAVENTRLYEAEQAARAQAEAANRIKDEFLAVLSHELRSPLNPILGWARLMQTRNLNPQTATYALETIERNAKLQTQLIEDLLDVSRVLQGKMSLNVGPVDLVTTVEAALETVDLAAAAKSIQLRTVFDPDVGMVLGDSNRLQQVVWNLLSNAVKFTPAGGQVEIKLEPVGAQAQLRITDTGKGIDAGFLPHIFDYFRQEDGATTRRFGGLGLGLAIVRHIVELHGGVVQAASPGDGKGTTFVVRLPLAKRQSFTADATTGTLLSGLEVDLPIHTHLQDLRILVVDDEQDSREMIAYVLEQAGLQVTAVASAQAALQLLAQTLVHTTDPPAAIDVLISDIGMPDMDGYMLMHQLQSQFAGMSTQSQAIAPQPPKAIALTAYAGEFNRQRALQAGFQGHLAKPVEPAALIAAIATVVGDSR